MPAQLYRKQIEGIVYGKPLETLWQCLNEMELALVTVRDVIARNCDGAPFEDSYIGVNLGLYVVHMDGIIRKCRELLDQPGDTRAEQSQLLNKA